MYPRGPSWLKNKKHHGWRLRHNIQVFRNGKKKNALWVIYFKDSDTENAVWVGLAGRVREDSNSLYFNMTLGWWSGHLNVMKFLCCFPLNFPVFTRSVGKKKLLNTNFQKQTVADNDKLQTTRDNAKSANSNSKTNAMFGSGRREAKRREK